MFEQRHLNFNKFLDERAQQISKFRDILKLQTKKKGHQALPKCIRRRAMSHNRYRIPSKMRKLNQQELLKSQNMQRIPKCRKHIRKTARLILSYKDRHSNIKWLSTHLWAARRMRMINYHGYKVAQTPNQKAFRSSYRHFMHNCCILDFSYYQCLTFKMSNFNDQMPECVSIWNEKLSSLQKELKLNELKADRSYEGYLYNRDNRLVCPLLIFNNGLQNNESGGYLLRCFFNPCAFEQIKQIFLECGSDKVQVTRCKSQLYCLIGPEWNNKIYQTLKIYGFNPNKQDINQLKYDIGKIKSFKSQKNIKVQTVPYISAPISSLIKQDYSTINESASIRNQTLKLFEMLTKKKLNNVQVRQQVRQQDGQFWQYYDSILSASQKVSISITSRSKYTHKRKNKLSKQNKKKVIQLQSKKKQLIYSKNAISQQQQQSISHEMISQSLQNIKNEIKQFFIQQKQSKLLISNQNKQQLNNKDKNKKQLKVNPILITSFKKQNLYQGCYILCSDDDSCRLWRILSKLNIKVIGLQELQHINLESHNLQFPYNYIETQSFYNHAQTQSIKQLNKIKRRPPQKRINFIKINSTNPFSLIQSDILSNSIKIFVQMVNRGRCFSNSYIYQPNQQDINLIDQQLCQKGGIGIVLSQTNKNEYQGGTKLNQKKFLDYSKQNIQSISNKLSNLKQKRKLIGRILTGGYLYTKSKQGGIGYVSKQIGQDLNNLKNQGYVLIRKVTSPHYYLAQITQIYPQLQRL